MIPGALQLRAAYFSLLSAQLEVPVFDNVYDSPAFPYVVIGDHNSNLTDGGNLGTKLDWIEDLALFVYVYAGRADDYGSKRSAHLISENVVKFITEGRGENLDLGPDHSLIFATAVNHSVETEPWETGRIQTAQIEFLNKITVDGTYESG